MGVLLAASSASAHQRARALWLSALPTFRFFGRSLFLFLRSTPLPISILLYYVVWLRPRPLQSLGPAIRPSPSLQHLPPNASVVNGPSGVR